MNLDLDGGTVEFAELINTMTQAACHGDGEAVAACFTPDGVYHDVFYGSFHGARIAELIEGFFHRDGTNFRWDIHDPVSDGETGYARYVFSYDSTLAGYAGRRACFEGVAMCRLSGGLIASYSEIANAATGLSLMGFEDPRVARFIAKQAAELISRDEAVRHRS